MRLNSTEKHSSVNNRTSPQCEFMGIHTFPQSHETYAIRENGSVKTKQKHP